MSRSRNLRPLPGELPETTRALLQALRSLRESAGYDLRALGTKTYASRSSWGRWLGGETWIPLEAVETLAEVCGGDVASLRALWHRADEDRRSPVPATEPTEPALDAATLDATALDATVGGDDGTVVTIARPEEAPVAAPAPRRYSRGTWILVAVTSLVCATLTGALGVIAGMSVRPAPKRPAHRYSEWITRPEILARARRWNPHSARRVPYSQDEKFDGYRTDGSGYASMALGLPTPGPNSTDLAWGGYSQLIPAARLRPGDLVINATGGNGVRRVAIFERWANPAHTTYWVYQQRRGYGTDHLVVNFPLAPGGDYHPYRPLNIQEHPAPLPTG